MTLLEALREDAVIISDGAVGTQLQKAGLPVGASPELWMLGHPEEVSRVHKEYADAGAQLITTNSFGGSRHKLEQFEAAGKFEDINRVAVELAREAAGDSAWVMATMGPLGVLMEPYGTFTAERAAEVYAEQAHALARYGADALLFETFYDLTELQAAVQAARSTQLPVFATVTFDSNGRTMMGATPVDVWNAVSDIGLDAFGANCSTGPEQMVAVVSQVRDAGAGVIIAQPNAGMPEQDDSGAIVYRQAPEDFARTAPALVAAGARIVGGCCGSTPEHIRAIRSALEA